MPEPQAVERVTGKTLHAFFFDRYHLRLMFTKADTWGVDRHKWNSFMKKLSLMILMLLVSSVGTICSAQSKFTVWYGANLSKVSFDGGSSDSELKPLNLGVDFTSALNDSFDWTVGASYVTKGGKDWDPGFVQIDANTTWNFVKSDDFKLGVLTGPYADILVAKDDAEGTKSLSMGWQAGVKASYKVFSFKAGYELGLSDVFKDGKSKANSIYFRIGYSF